MKCSQHDQLRGGASIFQHFGHHLLHDGGKGLRGRHLAKLRIYKEKQLLWVMLGLKRPLKMCRNPFYSQMKSLRHRTRFFRTWQIALKLGPWALLCQYLGSKVREIILLYTFTNARTKVSQFRCVAFLYFTNEWNIRLQILVITVITELPPQIQKPTKLFL